MNIKKKLAELKKDIRENYPSYVGVVVAAATAATLTSIHYRRSMNALFEENYLIRKEGRDDELVGLVPITNDCVQMMKDGETLEYPTVGGRLSMKLDQF